MVSMIYSYTNLSVRRIPIETHVPIVSMPNTNITWYNHLWSLTRGRRRPRDAWQRPN